MSDFGWVCLTIIAVAWILFGGSNATDKRGSRPNVNPDPSYPRPRIPRKRGSE